MNLTGLSREALEEYAHNLEAIVAECRGEQDDQGSDEPTDLDLITGHPYQPSEWGDICGHVVDGWPCGYGLAEHADQGSTDGRL